jgi:outer membrane protein TolC
VNNIKEEVRLLSVAFHRKLLRYGQDIRKLRITEPDKVPALSALRKTVNSAYNDVEHLFKRFNGDEEQTAEYERLLAIYKQT